MFTPGSLSFQEIGLSEPQLGEGGSRFSQWFGMATGAGGSGPCASRPSSSLEDSRRSSINEEFSYLNGINFLFLFLRVLLSAARHTSFCYRCQFFHYYQPF